MTHDLQQLLQKSSTEIDHYFGFKVEEIEKALYFKARELRPQGNLDNLGHVLHGGHQTWIGLEPDTINTPYQELARMIELLSPAAGSNFIDLGASYGRLGLVLKLMAPEVNFSGYELVPERVIEGNRVLNIWGCSGELFEADITSDDFQLPDAQYYFIYDFGKVQHIRKILNDLSTLADQRNFKVIARGKGIRSIIDHEHPWLSDVYAVIREENFAIYSMSGQGSLGPI